MSGDAGQVIERGAERAVAGEVRGSMRAPTPIRRCPIDVFAYVDFRRFLADLYAAKKPQGFSYRAFSRVAKLGAPNYLKLVIDGERNLTPAMAQRFAHACGLRAEAAAFFQSLVEFSQARTLAEREAGHAKLAAFARYREAHRLEAAHTAYHGNWYVPAIRELCASPAFVCDASWIASALVPSIKPQEAQKALDVLFELGLIERSAEHGVRQGTAVVSTGAQTRGMHIKRYHAEMMRRATAAMDLLPAAERDISSLTLCLGATGIARLRERIQAFRRELIDLAENETQREQVVQVNFQLFPLSTVATRPAGDGSKALRQHA
jgi:uncharacterized protein (TIGR02147 family)